jgi:hypothetical protein
VHGQHIAERNPECSLCVALLTRSWQLMRIYEIFHASDQALLQELQHTVSSADAELADADVDGCAPLRGCESVILCRWTVHFIG